MLERVLQTAEGRAKLQKIKEREALKDHLVTKYEAKYGKKPEKVCSGLVHAFFLRIVVGCNGNFLWIAKPQTETKPQGGKAALAPLTTTSEQASERTQSADDVQKVVSAAAPAAAPVVKVIVVPTQDLMKWWEKEKIAPRGDFFLTLIFWYSYLANGIDQFWIAPYNFIFLSFYVLHPGPLPKQQW